MDSYLLDCNSLTLLVEDSGSDFMGLTEKTIEQAENEKTLDSITEEKEEINEEHLDLTVAGPACSLCSNRAFPCEHCKNAANIKNTRLECKVAQKRQAEKMLETTKKKFKPAQVGLSVRIPVPDVDRSRTDHRNILGVIMSVEDDDFYRLGTLHGIIKQLFARNQFDICKQKFLAVEDVKDIEITLRSAVGCTSVSGNTQGYIRCQCTKRCVNKKCKCVSSGLTCNSKCHHSQDCANK